MYIVSLYLVTAFTHARVTVLTNRLATICLMRLYITICVTYNVSLYNINQLQFMILKLTYVFKTSSKKSIL